MPRTICQWIGAGIFTLYLCVAITWSVANFRDIPHYGDTLYYLDAARDLKVSEHRGILYPVLLAGAGELCLEKGLAQPAPWLAEGTRHDRFTHLVPAGLSCIQVLQVTLALFSLAYFLYVVVGHELARAGTDSREGRTILGLLICLLLLDPLINHFNFAVMTDGLALAASLAFCAALTDLGVRKTSPRLAGIILFISYFVAAGLRVEKKWVLLATLLMSAGVWTLMNRGTEARLHPTWRRRLLVAFVLVCVGLFTTNIIHDTAYKKSSWMSLGDAAIHLRLIFPHLSEVHDDLPPRAKQLITKRDAFFYDRNINNPQKLIPRVTGGDDELRRQLTRDMVETVIPRKWRLILLDTVRDGFANLFSTASFYSGIVAWKLGGNDLFEQWFFPDATVWNYQRIAFHHPRLSAVYMLVSLALLSFCMPIALRRAHRCVTLQSWRKTASEMAVWVPVITFWLLNAASLAVTVNIVNVRYTLISHALLLVWIFTPAVKWWLAGTASSEDTSRSRVEPSELSRSMS